MNFRPWTKCQIYTFHSFWRCYFSWLKLHEYFSILWPNCGSGATCGSFHGFMRLLRSCQILCLYLGFFYSTWISRTRVLKQITRSKKCTAKQKYEDEDRKFLTESPTRSALYIMWLLASDWLATTAVDHVVLFQVKLQPYMLENVVVTIYMWKAKLVSWIVWMLLLTEEHTLPQ